MLKSTEHETVVDVEQVPEGLKVQHDTSSSLDLCQRKSWALFGPWTHALLLRLVYR